MSFFNFRNQNKFADIAKILSQNELTSKASLHEKHPHTKAIFERHSVDLRQIRRKGVKATAAATALGAFLAFPHLLGNGVLNEPKPTPNLRTLSIEKQVEPQTNSNHRVTNHNESNSSSIIANHPNSGTVVSDESKHKSQGHIHGRSYLAPPKEHGFHDLGLHKGEDNGNGNAQSPGPHPEDLGINHPEKNK